MTGEEEGSANCMTGRCTTEQEVVTGEEGSTTDPTLRPCTSEQKEVAGGVGTTEPMETARMGKPVSLEGDGEDREADGYYEYDEEGGESDEYEYEYDEQEVLEKETAPDPQQMQATIDRIVEETRLQDAVAAAAGKQRLPDNQVKFILALKRETFPNSDEENLQLSKFFSPEWIEEKRKLDEEAAALCEEIQDGFEDFRKDVQQQWETKGKVEFDNEYFKQRAESELWMKREWAKMDFSRVVVSKSRDKRTIKYDP